MFGEERQPRERFGTGWALEAFDIFVSLLMSSQVRPISKGPRAELADEGFLAGVGPDVTLQKPRPRESLITEVALAWKRMGADVHLQGSESFVRFVTLLADEDLLSLVAFGCWTVELLVLR